ncbi:NLP/P60-family protein [Streptantibioticus cattleyicolor NRRL 8057 = DSM 46488]|uniref:NLP/P60-family protein n=1 Tax=Streptantibioticus cattleyicolor (strain ATCC 35852 / DSM 46488 / JCM 4925 / NBRC 14057 / NRRL 8057) TaxID=1003195 RepID=G8WUF2_STREN|nr:NLP/P60-family protein [Streptantibioticus cattleyicolor NRRL 8057 = DSM 46488]
MMGATGPTAYDCSGLVQAAFRTIGVDLPRVSEDQSTAGTQVSLDALQPGDILYWGGAGSAYHVAVYVGGGNFIGAQNPSSGVVERPLSYSQPTGAVRVA